MKKALLFCVCTFLLFIHVRAQRRPFTIGVIDSIVSVSLSETRLLNIYLPEGYDKDTASYPVIYLLDGSANEDFVHTAGLLQFLTMNKQMPASILVGIANVDRKRDFTHPAADKADRKFLPTSGGSARFRQFIKAELQPYIVRQYRCREERTLIGQSLGGLLASEILLHTPELFDNYIIVSPSLWWDRSALLSQAKALLQSHQQQLPRQVYVSVGTEGKKMEGDVQTLVDQLRAMNATQMKVHFVPLPQENHATILHNSLYRAFELLYRPVATSK